MVRSLRVFCGRVNMRFTDDYFRPPRVSLWLLKRFYPDRKTEALIGDLAEAYQAMVRDQGTLRARLWFRWQVLKAIPEVIKEFVYWRSVMFKSYLKLAYRHMKRQKVYSFINIAGLTLGMTCTILILLWIQGELSFDRFHEKKQDIYRVVSIGTETSFFGTPSPFAPAVLEEVPELVNAVRVLKAPRFVFKYQNNAFYEDNGIIADPSFFEMFSFPLLQGEARSSFAFPLNIILTQSFAKKYFGDEDPLGKSLQLEGRTRVKVVGIMADVPANSHMQFDYVLPHTLVRQMRLCGTKWGDFNFMTYIQVMEKRDEDQISQKLNEVSIKHGCPQVVQKQLALSIQPLEKIYLNPLGNHDIPLGDKRYVYVFSVIAIFILFIACVNFINLSTARSEKRAREVGLRKVMGADRSQVMKQFFGETIIMALLSLILAVALARILMPVFNGVTGESIPFTLFNATFFAGLFGISLIVGVLAGLYPALYLSSFEPVNVLRHKLGFRAYGKKLGFGIIRKGALRRALVVLQFSLSIMLILATTVVYDQLNYIRDQSWKQEDSVLLYIPFKESLASKYDVIKTELLQHPDITAVAAKDVVPTSLRNNTSGIGWEGKSDEQNSIHMETTRIGYDYFHTMDMPIVSGRGFSKDYPGDVGHAFVVNEEAVKVMGVQDPIGKMFRLYANRGTLVGVVQNTYFQSLKNSLRPQVFHLFTNMPYQANSGVVLIRVRAEMSRSFQNVISHIEGIWHNVNFFAPFEYHFLDETIEAQYFSEKRLGRLFSYFAFLAIFISCLGLFGLASFVAEQKTKEIGIRKTLGASYRDIVVLLSRDFTLWVLAANVIAWPVGWWFMHRWLQNFAYRTSVNLSSFVAAAVLALAIAWLTVSLQMLKTARSNPVDALRYE
jgi:putative ABC transport system permease protein